MDFAPQQYTILSELLSKPIKTVLLHPPHFFDFTQCGFSVS
jgi:hypothetical protein